MKIKVVGQRPFVLGLLPLTVSISKGYSLKDVHDIRQFIERQLSSHWTNFFFTPSPFLIWKERRGWSCVRTLVVKPGMTDDDFRSYFVTELAVIMRLSRSRLRVARLKNQPLQRA